MAAYSIPHHWFYSDLPHDLFKANADMDTNINDVAAAAELPSRHHHQLHYCTTLPSSSWVVQDHNDAILQLPADQGSMNNCADAALMFPDTMPSSFNFQHQHQATFFDAHHPPAAASLNFSAEVAGSMKMEESAGSSLQVGRYSVEERKDRILRYLKKRNQRNFTKTIKYACRKTLADRRVRVRGRFARNTELSDEDPPMMRSMAKDNNSSDDDPFLITNSYNISSFSIHDQVKPQQLDIDDEDEWLQEAVANLELMYLPPTDHIRTSSITSAYNA